MWKHLRAGMRFEPEVTSAVSSWALVLKYLVCA